ncbi:AMP-binding protein, partial [Castellaniella sp.]|uniref:non-ribosomal peptide synthetase n=1 Tax=Castellaniella sp. TaxID=1955812 RepID=UPI00355E5961
PAAQFTEALQTADQTRETPEALAWWRNTLDGAPAEISLPLDQPRPAERGQRAGMLSLPLPDDADLSDIARANGATPFMAYLAVYAWLLQRWSGDDDMVIGCPVSTRKTRADQDMVGFMVSTVPLRLQPDLNDDLATRITQVKHALLGALDQSGVTLDQMVSALNPKRHLNRNPLFQAMFVLQAQPLVPPSLHDTTIEALPVAPLAPEVDLNLSLERTSDPHAPWLAQLEYDPDLFDERTIQAFLTQFIDLCRTAAAQVSGRQQPASPHAPALWQGPSASLPDRPIHDLILETLHAKDPGTVLLTDHHGSLSCAQVLTRIERTADALHAHGVTRQTRVGLCLPRLTERVPTLLALWQCGGCAVFLPTDGPPDAILTRARQAGISILVTGADSPDLDEASAHDLRRIACQTLLDTTATACPPVPFPPTTGLDVLPAYVCFTSGSTGEPKTVFISHASLLNHALDTRHRFGLQANDQVLQFAAPAFDVALEETLPALLAGAPLVQPAPAQTRDLDAFEQALTQHGISVANLPAAFWHTWVHERVAHGTPIPPSLRLLITGSEAVQASAARIWRKQAPHCALMCGYGLTETTISATFLSVDDVPASWSTLPLGTPVPNTEIAVTGPDNQLLPPLCVGEIRVRGQALMLSATRDGDFTPLAELRTGDRGRMDLDGQLWCLGRRDRQIKIRGIRVEPATLERALIQIPGITDAAALVRQTGSRHRLWAFIVGANAPSLEAIKATLQNSLADVLIPEHILALPSLPVTSQGKTDYRALAHLADSAPASATVSPLNSDHERLVAQLFSDVLQRHPIGPDDNFFDLGGDSISSLQVISRARRAGLELSAKTIFEHQTVRAIARNAASASSSSDDAEAIGPVWATPILSWFKGEMHGNWRQFNQAVVIALPDPVDLPRLQQALQAVVACHEIFGLQVSRSPQGAINYHI